MESIFTDKLLKMLRNTCYEITLYATLRVSCGVNVKRATSALERGKKMRLESYVSAKLLKHVLRDYVTCNLRTTKRDLIVLTVKFEG